MFTFVKITYIYMNTRLQQFLSVENISQSQLADTLGVARASISHILSGRNKPGFDFIESLSRHYPTINLEWLITGKGKMYKEPISSPSFDVRGSSSKTSSAVQKPAEATLFGDMEEPALGITETNTLDKNTKHIEYKRSITKIIVFYDDNTFQELK